MRSIGRRLLTAAATTGVLAVVAPVSGASASTWPINSPSTTALGGQLGTTGCNSNAPADVGPAGSTVNFSCGSVLSFIGPSIGQVATVIGPTIIGATVLGPVTVSAGPVKN